MSVKTAIAVKKSFTNYDLLVSVFDSGIATQFNLKSSSLNILNGLCRYYNHKTNKVFPGINKLAVNLNLNEKTVRAGIIELISKGLILKSKNRGHNEYLFTNKFFEAIQKPAEISNKITVKNIHEGGKTFQKEPVKIPSEQNKYINKINITSCSNIADEKIKPDDDFSLKNNTGTDVIANPKIEYKKLIEKLESWQFTGSHFIIKKHGIDRINELCKLVETKNPNNKGAYLRSLLNLPYNTLAENKKDQNKIQESIKKLMQDERSYLNNFTYADSLLNGINIINNKIKENDIKIIIEIQEIWHVETSKYFTIQFLETMCSNDPVIADFVNAYRAEVKQAVNACRIWEESRD
jgi:predicted transcriptional regulator